LINSIGDQRKVAQCNGVEGSAFDLIIKNEDIPGGPSDVDASVGGWCAWGAGWVEAAAHVADYDARKPVFCDGVGVLQADPVVVDVDLDAR